MAKEINGKKYLSEKEIAQRYGYSVSFFQKLRYNNAAPPYVKLNSKRHILYPIDETDRWFQENLKIVK